jgi:ATP-dependent exoDNAse (exonuclease V) beta subunit
MSLPSSITFISAGAGSGKTYQLTELLLKRLRARSAEPAGVLATTFTNKAANELRERVQTDLLKAGEHAYAQAMGQARIGTVNSVCGALVGRFAFELGLPPVLEVLDEVAAKALIAESVDVAIDVPRMAEIGEVARRLDLDAESWQEDLQELIQNARANGLEGETLRAMAGRNAEDLLRQFPPVARDDLDRAMRRAIEAVLPQLEAALERKPTKVTKDCLELFQEFRDDLESGNARWVDWVRASKAKAEKALADAIQPVLDAAARFPSHPRLREDLRRYLDLMFAACADVLAVYDTRKRELGVMDFVDQERRLLEALDMPSVREVLADELQLLMVDEFQDTSPIQLALFVKLAALARETIWVGDLKQAIYGFRGSDVSLMQAVLAALPGAGGQIALLDKSWRSRASLVALTNAVFTRAFDGVLAPESVALKPQRSEPEGLLTFGNWLLEGKKKAEYQQALARGIRALVDSRQAVEDPRTRGSRPVSFGDIAILARSNDNVSEIAAALRANGIPVSTEQPGLLQQPECVLALACLRRLYDRADTLATAEILALADCARPETWLADRLRHLERGGDRYAWRETGDDAHPLLTKLAGLRSELLLAAPREALQLVIIQCGLVSRVLRWSSDAATGRSRVANLDRLLELAQEYEDVCRSRRRVGTVADLLRWLEQQAADEEDEIAVPALDAVSVLTHHGAKGLEWPVVVLTDLTNDIRTRLWSITTVSEGGIDVSSPLKNRFIRFWPWAFGPQKSCDFVTRIEDSETGRYWAERARAEEIRLLYVSMTRARDLMILARPKKEPTGEWIDALQAPWLLTQEGQSDLPLPGGAEIRCSLQSLSCDPPEPRPATGATLHWLAPWELPAPRPPLLVSPSLSEPVPCEVGDFERVGRRIAVKGSTNMTDLGTAVHAAIAASVVTGGRPLDLAQIEKLLQSTGVAGRVDPAHVREQIDALVEWLERRWPSHRRYSEIAVESVLDTGRVLRGQVDLLLDTDSGWVLVDHKSGPASAEQWRDVAIKYSGQLAAYAQAIEKASGRPVMESWLFLPVAGGALRLTPTKPA